MAGYVLILFWEVPRLYNRPPENVESKKAARQAARQAKFMADQAKLFGQLFLEDFRYEVIYHELKPSSYTEFHLESAIGHFLDSYNRPENTLIIYYGGHADGTWGLHICPSVHESSLATPPGVASEMSPQSLPSPLLTIDIRHYTRGLRNSTANTYLILDCCFAGRIISDSIRFEHRVSEDRNITFEQKRHIAEIFADNDVKYLVACSKSTPTSLGEKTKSFTSAFIEECKNILSFSPKGVDIDMVYNQVSAMSELVESPIKFTIKKNLVNLSSSLPVFEKAQGETQWPRCNVANNHLTKLRTWLCENLDSLDGTEFHMAMNGNISQLIYLCELQGDAVQMLEGKAAKNSFGEEEAGEFETLIRDEITEILRTGPKAPNPSHSIAQRAFDSYFQRLLHATTDLVDRLEGQLSVQLLLSGIRSSDATSQPLKRSRGAWLTNLRHQAQAKAIFELEDQAQDLSDIVDIRHFDTQIDIRANQQIIKKIKDALMRRRENESKSSTTFRDQYQNCTWEGSEGERHALVEVIQLSKDIKPDMFPNELQRVIHLAYILNTLDGERFRLLPCVGYVKDTERKYFGLVFDLDNPRRHDFGSLRQCLRRKKHQPSPESRRKAAFLIARAVAKFHLLGRVHKGIRSSNVRLTMRSEDPNLPDFESPWLLGFSFSREEVDGSWRLTSNGPEHDVYNYPDRWGQPSEKFSKLHDIYSLGVLLLELGMGRVVERFEGEADWTKWHIPEKGGYPDGKALVKQFERLASECLEFFIDKSYKQAVCACLKVMQPDSPLKKAQESGPGELWDAFNKYVLDRLRH